MASRTAGYVDLDARRLGEVVTEAIHRAEPDDLLIVHVLRHGMQRRGSVMIVGADGETRAGASMNSWMLDATGDDEVEHPEQRSGPDEAKARVLFLVGVCFAGWAAHCFFSQGHGRPRQA